MMNTANEKHLMNRLLAVVLCIVLSVLSISTAAYADMDVTTGKNRAEMPKASREALLEEASPAFAEEDGNDAAMEEAPAIPQKAAESANDEADTEDAEIPEEVWVLEELSPSEEALAGEGSDTSGACGDNLFWTLTDQCLVITGSGEMTSTPWKNDGLYWEVTSLDLPDGLTSIAPYAFANCPLVGEIVIPDTVREIGQSAFSYCYGISSVKFPANLEKIGASAFYDAGLTAVDLPDSVTEIGESAFQYCKNIVSVRLSANVVNLGRKVFESDSELKEVDFNGAAVDIPEEAFWYCKKLETVRGTEHITGIGYKAFYECEMLKGFAMPDGIAEIPDWAFYYCENMETFSFGEGLETIGENAFYECRSLTEVVLPEGVRTIGRRAFSCARKLESIYLPASLESIGEEAFQFNYALKEICLPVNLKSLGKGAFSSCTALTKVEIPGSLKVIEGGTFDYCSKVEDVYFYGTEFGGYSFPKTESSQDTMLHILYFIGPWTLTPKDGAIYSWYLTKPDKIVNDIRFPDHYRVVADSVPGGFVSAPSYCKAGDTVSFTVTPDEGCEVVSVQAAGKDGSPLTLTAGADGAFSFLMPEEDVEIAADFRVTDGYYEVVIGEGEGGTVVSDKIAAQEGEVITLTAKPDDGYRGLSVSTDDDGIALTDNGNGSWSFEMPARDVVVAGSFEEIWDFDDTGEERVWLLENTEDWDALAAYSSEGRNLYEMAFRMEEDISVTTMVGRFNGRFDGNGHTLTLNYTGAESEYAAPFTSVDIATIEDLHVDGTVSCALSSVRMSGLIGISYGRTIIKDVLCSAIFEIGNGNHRYHGSLIGTVGYTSFVTVTGCVFDGKILGSDSESEFSGLAGWCNGEYAANDSFFAPSEYAFSGTGLNLSLGDTVRCYATRRQNDSLELVYSLSVQSGISADIDRGALIAEYDVSGLAIYEKALIFADTYYVQPGVEIGLGLSCDSGSSAAIYRASAGTLIRDGSGYFLTMPDEDVHISVFFPIIVNDSIQNGKVSVAVEEAAFGEAITFTAEPYEGYTVYEVTVNGNEPDIVDGTYSFVMPADAAVLDAVFVPSGKCGDDLYWRVTAETLTIYGTGDMYDYGNNSNVAPWSRHSGDIKIVVVEDGVSGIGTYAFSHTRGVKEVTLPDTLHEIRAWAFAGGKMSQIVIPGSVESIGDGAFVGCSSLAKLVLSEGVASLGIQAFVGCKSLTDITIPASMRKIEKDAFYNCTSIENVYIRGNDYSGYAFDTFGFLDDFGGDTTATVLHLPKSMDPASLTEENGNAVYYWVKTKPDRVLFDLSDAEEPSFAKTSLALGGRIGFNCFMDLPVGEGLDYSESYMEFTVSGKNGDTTIAPYDPAFMNSTGELYGFACHVNAIQMADEITAVFHYRQDGEEKTIEKKASVKEYILEYMRRAAEEPDVYGPALPLVKALADYGHYAQIFLSDNRNWKIGTDHAEMDVFYGSFDSGDLEGIAAALSGFGIEKSLNGDIEKISATLVLDSETSMNMLIKRSASYTGSVAAKLDGEMADAVRQKDGRYKVVIPDIPVQKLGEPYTVTLATAADSDPCTVRVSALSYAYAYMGSSSASDAGKNAMAALYRYYAAAADYIH